MQLRSATVLLNGPRDHSTSYDFVLPFYRPVCVCLCGRVKLQIETPNTPNQISVNSSSFAAMKNDAKRVLRGENWRSVNDHEDGGWLLVEDEARFHHNISGVDKAGRRSGSCAISFHKNHSVPSVGILQSDRVVDW